MFRLTLYRERKPWHGGLKASKMSVLPYRRDENSGNFLWHRVKAFIGCKHKIPFRKYCSVSAKWKVYKTRKNRIRLEARQVTKTGLIGRRGGRDSEARTEMSKFGEAPK